MTIDYTSREPDPCNDLATVLADKITSGWCLLFPPSDDVLDCFLAGVYLEEPVTDAQCFKTALFAGDTFQPVYMVEKSLDLQFWLGDIEPGDFDRMFSITLEDDDGGDINAFVDCCAGDVKDVIVALLDAHRIIT